MLLALVLSTAMLMTACGGAKTKGTTAGTTAPGEAPAQTTVTAVATTAAQAAQTTAAQAAAKAGSDQGDQAQPGAKTTPVSIAINGQNYQLQLSPGSKISLNQGILTIELLQSGQDKLDLSALANVANVTQLQIYGEEAAVDSVIVPNMPNLAAVDIDLDKVGRLDLSQLPSLQSLKIRSHVQEVLPPPVLMTLDVGVGVPLLPFAKCKSLTYVFTGVENDLKALQQFPELTNLTLYRLKETEHVNLAPLAGLKLEYLTAHDFSDPELQGLKGLQLASIEISDRSCQTLGFIASLKGLKSISILVAPDQPKAVAGNYGKPLNAQQLEALHSPLPKADLQAFMNQGGLVAVTARQP